MSPIEQKFAELIGAILGRRWFEEQQEGYARPNPNDGEIHKQHRRKHSETKHHGGAIRLTIVNRTQRHEQRHSPGKKNSETAL